MTISLKSLRHFTLNTNTLSNKSPKKRKKEKLYNSTLMEKKGLQEEKTNVAIRTKEGVAPDACHATFLNVHINHLKRKFILKYLNFRTKTQFQQLHPENPIQITRRMHLF